uniref:DC1 domain-containing protein n=1 Tax=Leersia perrieri TaxID=77586 RepID=A0A0D9Y128_9ORYZ
MRYGEVVHFSHPQHRLRLIHSDAPFRCDGCREVGIGARYRCPFPACDHDLHRQCAIPISPPPPPLRHPFYPRCSFVFLPRAPGPPSAHRYCNACGRDVTGFLYHCRSCGFDLHPCCASLPHVLDVAGGGVRLYLHPKAAAACHRCGNRGRSWTYRSGCKSYSLHVACVVDLLVDSWHAVGRNKGGGGGGNLYDAVRVPVIRGAGKSSHGGRGGGGGYWGRKGKVKRCCEIAGFAAQVVISAVLGDPTALIAGVIGSLIAR